MRVATLILLTLLAVAAHFWTGCRPGSSSSANSGRRAREFPTNVIAYPAKGVLQEIRAGGWKAVIAHEEIPGYMEAMTMMLDVRRTNELAGLQPGDTITFRVLVTDTDGWIDQVRRIASGPAPSRAGSNGPASTTALSAAGSDELAELMPGALLPDCTLTNQAGQTIRLSDFRGRALAFTFIFTRCPFPVYCPRLNQNFAAVQTELARAAATDRIAGTNWHLLSISFDSEFDTPARLATYATTYRNDPAHWSFATGTTEDIRRLGSGFTLAFWKEGALYNHNIRTVVVDAAGRVQRIFNDNEWKPAELIAELRTAMRAK